MPVATTVSTSVEAIDADDASLVAPEPAEAPVVFAPVPRVAPDPRLAGFLQRNRRFLVTGVVIPLIVLVAVVVVVAVRSGDDTVYPVAAEGESIIVLAPFVNYTTGGQGFNVLGRLRSAVDSELQEAGLTAVRTVEWPKEIGEEEAAREASIRANATLVIWGEYDSGRVIAPSPFPAIAQRRRHSRLWTSPHRPPSFRRLSISG